jgi:hypothetical protein
VQSISWHVASPDLSESARQAIRSGNFRYGVTPRIADLNQSQDFTTTKMRPLIYTLLAASLATAALPHFQRPLIDNKNLGPAMPTPADSPATSKPADPDTVVLSDVLGRDRELNIFAGFTRDFAHISGRFDDSSLNTTILAPINSAIMALPRKPWEDPKEYEDLGANAYGGDEGAERARKNLQHFVESHVVPASPWKEGDKLKTLSGDQIWWETRDGVRMVSPFTLQVSIFDF